MVCAPWHSDYTCKTTLSFENWSSCHLHCLNVPSILIICVHFESIRDLTFFLLFASLSHELRVSRVHIFLFVSSEANILLRLLLKTLRCFFFKSLPLLSPCLDKTDWYNRLIEMNQSWSSCGLLPLYIVAIFARNTICFTFSSNEQAHLCFHVSKRAHHTISN